MKDETFSQKKRSACLVHIQVIRRKEVSMGPIVILMFSKTSLKKKEETTQKIVNQDGFEHPPAP